MPSQTRLGSGVTRILTVVAPGGMVIFGPGYNCSNAIAEDLGIEKWWREQTAGGKQLHMMAVGETLTFPGVTP